MPANQINCEKYPQRKKISPLKKAGNNGQKRQILEEKNIRILTKKFDRDEITLRHSDYTLMILLDMNKHLHK
jgi:hypothetical protein